MKKSVWNDASGGTALNTGMTVWAEGTQQCQCKQVYSTIHKYGLNCYHAMKKLSSLYLGLRQSGKLSRGSDKSKLRKSLWKPQWSGEGASVNRAQFKRLHLRWYEGALVPLHGQHRAQLERHHRCWKVHTGFTATCAPMSNILDSLRTTNPPLIDTSRTFIGVATLIRLPSPPPPVLSKHYPVHPWTHPAFSPCSQAETETNASQRITHTLRLWSYLEGVGVCSVFRFSVMQMGVCRSPAAIGRLLAEAAKMAEDPGFYHSPSSSLFC